MKGPEQECPRSRPTISTSTHVLTSYFSHLQQAAPQGHEIAPGPLATFQGWKDKARHVRKGEKALTLCMPVTVKRTTESDEGEEEPCFTSLCLVCIPDSHPP
jgi:hypothetical protein